MFTKLNKSAPNLTKLDICSPKFSNLLHPHMRITASIVSWWSQQWWWLYTFHFKDVNDCTISKINAWWGGDWSLYPFMTLHAGLNNVSSTSQMFWPLDMILTLTTTLKRKNTWLQLTALSETYLLGQKAHGSLFKNSNNVPGKPKIYPKFQSPTFDTITHLPLIYMNFPVEKRIWPFFRYVAKYRHSGHRTK